VSKILASNKLTTLHDCFQKQDNILQQHDPKSTLHDYLKQWNAIDGDGVIGVSAITTTLCLYPCFLLYLPTMPLNTN
jgi:hypothetical protein